VATKRILLKLPRFIEASDIKKRSGVSELRDCPIVVQRLGYFEDEDEHPYRDWLTDLPNEWDHKFTPPGLAPIRGATERKQKFVCELYAPENYTIEKALGKVKPSKVLYEEIL